MRPWHLSHRVGLTNDEHVLDFTQVVLRFTFNCAPVGTVSGGGMGLGGSLTSQQENLSDMAYVERAVLA